MKNYEWILFDADETLIRFDSQGALKNLFSKLNASFTKTDLENYELKNKMLWVDYQNGNITSKTLREERFKAFSHKLNIPPLALDDAFLEEVTHITTPLSGAMNLLSNLKEKTNTKLGIITNGFSKTQLTRIQKTGMDHHFDLFIVSEEVGLPKPHPGIFEHAFEKMGNPAKDKVLMVGDTLESDILGGINAGIHTCWLNPHKKTAPAHIIPHFEVASLHELETRLF